MFKNCSFSPFPKLQSISCFLIRKMLKGAFMGFNAVALTTYRRFYCQAQANSEQNRNLNDLTAFKFKTREEHLKEVKTDPNYEVLVIGGGITGAGVLLDASRKNLRTLLIESYDFSAGSSSKSTKLLHGGLRYLENAFKPFNTNRGEDFHLVQEALNERNLLLNTAPHLASKIGIVVPTTNLFWTFFYYTGCVVYQNFERVFAMLSRKSDNFTAKLPFKLPAPRVVFRNELQDMFPKLSPSYKYGVLMWDGQVDDSRLVVETILTATAMQDPAVRQNNALNFCRLVEFKKDANGRIIGAILEDKLTKQHFEVATKVAINATGIMADKIRKLANEDLKNRVLASKGDHLTLENSAGQIIKNAYSDIGLLIPKTKDGRLMFVLPWKQSVIAGTTDKMVENPTVNALPDDESSLEISNSVQEYFDSAELVTVSKWAGFRPLVYTPKENPLDNLSADAPAPKVDTKSIKRTHVVEVDEKSGLVSVMGGKLTIFRAMGEDAVNQAMKEMHSKGQLSDEEFKEKQKRSTRNLRLIGDFRSKLFDLDADSDSGYEDRAAFLDVLKNELKTSAVKLDADVINYLVQTYGHRALIIKQKFEKDASNALRLDAKYPFTRGEIEHIFESEMAVTPTEILTNRLRLAFINGHEAERLLPVLIDAFGDFAKWDDKRKREEFKFNQELLKMMRF